MTKKITRIFDANESPRGNFLATGLCEVSHIIWPWQAVV